MQDRGLWKSEAETASSADVEQENYIAYVLQEVYPRVRPFVRVLSQEIGFPIFPFFFSSGFFHSCRRNVVLGCGVGLNSRKFHGLSRNVLAAALIGRRHIYLLFLSAESVAALKGKRTCKQTPRHHLCGTFHPRKSDFRKLVGNSPRTLVDDSIPAAASVEWAQSIWTDPVENMTLAIPYFVHFICLLVDTRFRVNFLFSFCFTEKRFFRREASFVKFVTRYFTCKASLWCDRSYWLT